jgi:hypothetical protein
VSTNNGAETEESAAGGTSDDPGGELYLNRLQFADRLGVDAEKLRRYMEGNEVFFGGRKAGKGHVYPISSEAMIRSALAMTPASFRAQVREISQRGGTTSGAGLPAPVAQSANVPASANGGPELVAALRGFAEVLRALSERSALPPTPDRLLTAEQAAELLLCAPRSVGRYVKPLRPGVWRQSDVQKYIDTGEPQV